MYFNISVVNSFSNVVLHKAFLVRINIIHDVFGGECWDHEQWQRCSVFFQYYYIIVLDILCTEDMFETQKLTVQK